MENIDVRNCVKKVDLFDYSFKEDNRRRNDEFIREQLYSADAAWDRLRLLRKTMKEWQNAINNLDRRDVPSETIEKYERVWAGLREIESDELEVIKFGE